jgi:hypothetical protein
VPETNTSPGSHSPSSRAAVDVVALDDHVAEIDADAELDPDRLVHIRVVLPHRALDAKRVADRIDGAGEFDQQAVARRLDDATAIGRDPRIDQLRL